MISINDEINQVKSRLDLTRKSFQITNYDNYQLIPTTHSVQAVSQSEVFSFPINNQPAISLKATCLSPIALAARGCVGYMSAKAIKKVLPQTVIILPFGKL